MGGIVGVLSTVGAKGISLVEGVFEVFDLGFLG